MYGVHTNQKSSNNLGDIDLGEGKKSIHFEFSIKSVQDAIIHAHAKLIPCLPQTDPCPLKPKRTHAKSTSNCRTNLDSHTCLKVMAIYLTYTNGHKPQVSQY